MRELIQEIDKAAAAVRKVWDRTPQVGIVLGSGLGEFAEQLEVEATVDYQQIPNFARATALGHRGQLVCGRLEGKSVLAFQGRFHLYEGHSPQRATLPVRLLQRLGGDTLFVSNAAGGLNPYFSIGDLMLIDDHVNLLFRNPLIGINADSLGPRFPDMSAPYDHKLGDLAMRIARREDFTLHRGVYFAMLGPTYETRAEYRMARRLGGDAVGMSTVPEVVVACHAGMRVLGLSIITNVGSPDTPAATSGHDVLAAAAGAAENLTKVLRGVLRELPSAKDDAATSVDRGR